MRRNLHLALLVVLGGAIACAPADDSDEELTQDELAKSPGATLFLEQGWGPADRAAWEHLSDGSGIMPVPWLAGLEMPANESMLLADVNMRALGFIPSPKSATNPLGLPVGLTIQNRPLGPLPLVGSNCATCHESEITYRGKTLRIHGGQSLATLNGFVTAAFGALGATMKTLQTADRSKFDRFAARVFAATGQAATFVGPDAEAKKKAAVEQLVAAIKAVLERVGAGAAFDAAHGITIEGWGPYRTDAIQAGANVLGAKLKPDNKVALDAPVSIPFVWGTPNLDWAQYNGSIRQPTGRNVVSVLARNAEIVLHDPDPTKAFDNSVELENVVTFEKLLQKLKAPKWPDGVFGKIDEAKAARGAPLYRQYCASCHEGKKGKDGLVVTTLLPLPEIGTDPNHAEHFASRRVDMAGFQGLGSVDLGVFSKVLTDGIIAKNMNPAVAAGMKATDGDRENDFRTPLAYRARPLDGIWASAPYLHNGSVPSLADLLLPVAKRPRVFFTGSKEFDPTNVGLVSDAGSFRFDTSLSGNHNTGHAGAAYGTELSGADRAALLEYLKTL